MTSELIALFDYYEREKGIHRSKLVEAISGALLTASKKSVGPARELRVDIDSQKGSIKVVAKLIVVEDVQNPYDEIPLKVARKIKKDAELGQEIDVEVTPKDFGRIAAQTAKQALMQRVRQEEKAMMYDEFKDRAGDIVVGTVRRFEKSDVIIDLGKFEATMPKKERVATEDYQVGDKIRAYVAAVENGPRGPEIILSRSHPNFVRRLFESEVSELADHTVQIRSIAREAGYRTKLAVFSADPKVDPVGACVGLQGRRVKNIVRELNNEKVDIIRWSDDPKQFVKDALKPANITDEKITLDPANKKIHVRVAEEDLAKAIGRNGQNVRLTKWLMGWDVMVERDFSAHEKLEGRVNAAADVLAKQLEIDPEIALHLVRGGMNSLELLATGADATDVAEILGSGSEEAEAIIRKARTKFGVDAESA
ncbi:MAG: transcription termination/antitermination protein NusA [Verrucomicrobiales bacterium]|nr:transcription termination/antitermination protein NusA [Verrucomicrobiales bacterium]